MSCWYKYQLIDFAHVICSVPYCRFSVVKFQTVCLRSRWFHCLKSVVRSGICGWWWIPPLVSTRLSALSCLQQRMVLRKLWNRCVIDQELQFTLALDKYNNSVRTDKYSACKNITGFIKSVNLYVKFWTWDITNCVVIFWKLYLFFKKEEIIETLCLQQVTFSALTLLVGWKEGHPACKNGGWWRWALLSLDGVVPSRMVGVSASVNLPLHHKAQKFSSGTGSPVWSLKKGRKMVVVWYVCYKGHLFLGIGCLWLYCIMVRYLKFNTTL